MENIVVGDLVRINETGANVYNDPVSKEKVTSLQEGVIGMVVKTTDIANVGCYMLVCTPTSFGWTHLVWFDKILRRKNETRRPDRVGVRSQW